MKQDKVITKIASVDVGKRHLDVAVHGLEEHVRVSNDTTGWSDLVAWLKAREVGRVGLEASGGYERAVVEALGAASFEVVLHQPLEVRLFARLKRQRAKSDRIDARVIAAATTQVEAVRAAQDSRLQALAERLRGPCGARDEFLLAATAQNLRKLAKLIPPTTPAVA